MNTNSKTRPLYYICIRADDSGVKFSRTYTRKRNALRELRRLGDGWKLACKMPGWAGHRLLDSGGAT